MWRSAPYANLDKTRHMIETTFTSEGNAITWTSKDFQNYELSAGVFMTGVLLDSSSVSSKTKKELPDGVGRLLKSHATGADAQQRVASSNSHTDDELKSICSREVSLHDVKTTHKGLSTQESFGFEQARRRRRRNPLQLDCRTNAIEWEKEQIRCSC